MESRSVALAAQLSALPERLSHVVRQWATQTPDAPALVEGDETLSYYELAQAIAEAASWLREYGLRPGDRAMLVGENSIALAVLVLAIGDIDAWPLVVNARISETEIKAIAAHSGSRLILYTTAVSPDAMRHAERMEALPQRLVRIGAFASGPLNESVVAEPVYQDGALQVGALIYTSGTTGSPKGVMLSHKSILFTAATGGVLREICPQDRVYGVLPMSHIVGFSSILVGTLMFGACLHLVPRFDASKVLTAFESEGVTRFQGVPTMYQRLLEHAKGGRLAHTLKGIGVAGAPLDQFLKDAVEESFGLVLHNGYGITECAPTISITRIENPARDTSVGAPIPGVEIKLVAKSGETVPRGEVGELHVRGPNVMLGYYRSQEQTAAALSADGWFNTGDLARLEEGCLHIVGRTKELIIRSGFNVYPPEVEAVLATHPSVATSAVVGRTVPGNEEVVAFVQLKPGATATSEDITSYAALRLAPYKRPAVIVIKESLPTTSAGKILKHLLAQEASNSANQVNSTNV